MTCLEIKELAAHYLDLNGPSEFSVEVAERAFPKLEWVHYGTVILPLTHTAQAFIRGGYGNLAFCQTDTGILGYFKGEVFEVEDFDAALKAYRDAILGDLEQLRACLGEPPLLAPEPPPKKGEGDVWREIIEPLPEGRLKRLCIERRQQGIQSYGTPLQRGNLRDPKKDEGEEHLDAAAYRAMRKGPKDPLVALSLLRAAECFECPEEPRIVQVTTLDGHEVYVAAMSIHETSPIRPAVIRLPGGSLMEVRDSPEDLEKKFR